MNFKNWLLESDQTIKYGGFLSNGMIIIYINKTRYVFITDATFHNKWERICRYKPWDVLNDIKSQVRNGHAKQIEPQPIKQIEPSKTNSKKSSFSFKILTVFIIVLSEKPLCNSHNNSFTSLSIAIM